MSCSCLDRLPRARARGPSRKSVQDAILVNHVRFTPEHKLDWIPSG